MKKVVILSANKNLSKHPQEDTILDIDIEAFALDNKEKIIVDRETTFVYPSPATIKKRLNK